MAPETVQPAAADTAAAGGADTPARVKVDAKVLAEARKRGKVITHPSAADVEENPGARGYDEHGMPRPADARAAFLVLPKPVKAAPDQELEARAAALRRARKAADKARREAEKAEG